MQDHKFDGMQYAKVVENLNQIGVLYKLSVSRPSFKTKLSFTDLGLPNIANVATPSSMKLIDEAKLAPFSNLGSRMRLLLNDNSVDFFGGLRYITWELFPAVNDKLQEMVIEWDQALETFAGEYAANQAAAVKAWEEPAGKIWDESLILRATVSRDAYIALVKSRVSNEWPTAKNLRSKFGVELRCAQISPTLSGGSGMDSTILANAQKLANQEIDSFVKGAMSELRKRTVEVCTHLRDVILNAGKVSEKSLNPLREWIDQFKALNFIDDKACAEYIKTLSEFAGSGNASALNEDTDYLSAFGEVLDASAQLGKEIADDIVQEQLLELSGKKVRKLNIGD